MSPRGCLEQHWKPSSHNLWWPSCSWCRGQYRSSMVLDMADGEVLGWSMVNDYYLSSVSTTWGENPPNFRSGPASPREAWEFSPELQWAQGCSPTRERRMGFFRDPLTCKDEQDVSLRLHLRYFCFFVHVFYGSIIEGQGLKAREQRLQRFGWFMGRDLKARGGICQHHGRHGICMDMPFLYTADVGILRLRFLQTCCRLQTARPGPRKVQYCSTEMKQPCVF